MLGRIASEATPNDAHVAADLVDTLEANLERCVGMAANMIGENKRIIAVRDGNRTLLMYNPEILDAFRSTALVPQRVIARSSCAF